MRFGSLFAGIGGFDLGLERAGMTCAWQCEIDPFAQKILARHWPNVKRYDDVTKLVPAEMEPVDLICGGFPCQDLSMAGKRAGLGGKRSGLFYELVRVVSRIRPQYFLLENVPGLFSSGGRRDFAAVIQALGDCGYGVAWRVLDSQYFGLAQRRKRVFIVGYFGAACPPEILFEQDGGGGCPAEIGKARNQVANAVTCHAAKGGYPTTDNYVSGTLSARHYHNDASDSYRIVSATLGCGGSNGSPFSGNNEPRGYIPAPYDSDGMHESAGLPGRMDGTRRPTPDSPQYRALGNAVSVPVAEWIGRRIMAVESAMRETK